MQSKSLSFFFALIASCCITMTAWGDDLEIYIGTNDEADTFPANVIFIMDTSGSMRGLDGGTESRLKRVQDALVEVLGSATNINAGLMRFSGNDGGPILFPATAISKPLDAEQVYVVQDDKDDAHESSNGSVSTGSDAVILTKEDTTRHAGFRFTNVNVPQGATITSAFLRFTSTGYDDTDAAITIFGEKTPSSQAFSATTRNISSRTKTDTSVVWNSNNTFPDDGDIITSPRLTSIIQEIVDQDDWCGGNALSLITQGSSNDYYNDRRATAADEGTSETVQLVVRFDQDSAKGCVNRQDLNYQVNAQSNNMKESADGAKSGGSSLVFRDNFEYNAVRFENIQIPQGALVTSARLVFTSTVASNDSVVTFNVSAINEDNTQNFNGRDDYYLRDIDKTASIPMPVGKVIIDEEYSSPELKSIVQSVIDRPAWQPGNALGFVMSGFTRDRRTAYTFNGQPSGSPQLIISYSGETTPDTSNTVRDYLISQVNQLTHGGNTPIVDTLYEAALYYSGKDVYYGLTRGTNSTWSGYRRVTRVSHEDSYEGELPDRPEGCDEFNLSAWECVEERIPSGATYISPIKDLQCQTNNHIVLLSDGRANQNGSEALIKSLLDVDTCASTGSEACATELVANLFDTDNSVVGTKVTTHTIGFASGNDVNTFLDNLAEKGGGGFYTADDSDGLVDVFKTILRAVKDVNTTFVSPGVAVNQLNRLNHRDDLYFALFKPQETANWPGNLKKYKIRNGQIIDSSEEPAVDGSSGFFRSASKSYWSDVVDGAEVGKGGAANELTSSRKVYFFDGAGNIATTGKKLNETNTAITAAMMAVNTDDERTDLLKWARGVDVKDEDGDGDRTDVLYAMGDPIHSQPVVVDYSETESAIFVATNHGFLHSIDADEGTENWAIIPKDLLRNIKTFYGNESTARHTYGLDGDMVLRRVGDKMYLYVGMRRGGQNYYALDVTAKDAPKVLFTIKGGSGSLEKLGQTWSKPIITKVKMGSTAKNVMIVGGGYDSDQDDKTVRSADSTGNAVFMFDADTGELLWSASSEDSTLKLADMKYSIPGRVSVIDRDADGYADHMYVADLGGQLFRFDIYNGESGNDFIKGARIADFGGDTAADNRKFYYGPDVSQVALGTDLFYAVAIGSGKRAAPLDRTINDNFYMLRDAGVFKIDKEGLYTFPEVATESDLYNATSHLLTSDDELERGVEASEFANLSGWMVNLTTSGEKVLATPLIINYKVFFTTYIPAASNDSLCAPPAGSSRAYLVNLLNGNAVDDINNDGQQDGADRSVDLNTTGIAPDPRVIFPPSDDKTDGPVICLGTECNTTTVQLKDDGTKQDCTSAFDCLAENIFGEFERVQRSSWRTETESQ